MTREEEIRDAAEIYSAYVDATDEEDLYNSTELEAFEDGAKWADGHPAKKQAVTIEAWVARDKDGKLYAYKRPPYKNLDKGKYYPSGNLDDDGIVLEEFDAFPSVTFENSPKKVKVTIEMDD